MKRAAKIADRPCREFTDLEIRLLKCLETVSNALQVRCLSSAIKSIEAACRYALPLVRPLFCDAGPKSPSWISFVYSRAAYGIHRPAPSYSMVELERQKSRRLEQAVKSRDRWLKSCGEEIEDLKSKLSDRDRVIQSMMESIGASSENLDAFGQKITDLNSRCDILMNRIKRLEEGD